MFRRVFPVVTAPARAALNSSPFFSTLASASPSSSGCVSASSSSSALMSLASALSSSLRRRSFASDAPAAGDAAQHKAPHGWGQTRVAELLESKVRRERTMAEGERGRDRL